MSLYEKITGWLQQHDDRLERFKDPVPLIQLSEEIDETIDTVRTFLSICSEPIYHVWKHRRRGNDDRTKPYCLHLSSPNDVCLDWEDSVVGAAEAELKRRGYECRREVGTAEHLALVLREASLDGLVAGVNQRDLFALKKTGADRELCIIEAKGKQAGGFDYSVAAEALGQLFPVPGPLLTDLLGSPKEDGHGRCWRFAQSVLEEWVRQGLRVTITLGLLLPEWAPDVIWSNKKARRSTAAYFQRPIAEIRQLLAGANPNSVAPLSKNLRAFRDVLNKLDASVGIKSLAAAQTGLRFKLLTTKQKDAPQFFELEGL